MLKRILLAAAAACALAVAPSTYASPALESPRALVMDAATGEVLLAKDADTVAAIASLTKLMTAMVTLDAQLDPFEVLTIDVEDLDRLKGTKSGVPVGASFTRRTLLRLALLSSDNHAAAALARTYPGGSAAFSGAVALKIASLGLQHTTLEEPTGLSPSNRSTAADMVKVLHAATTYPEISGITSQARATFDVNGIDQEFRNTNRLVGSEGWNILLSKTGYTREAGLCLTMLMESAGRKVLVVLMGARDGADRALDALNIRRWLAGEPQLAASGLPKVSRTTVTRSSTSSLKAASTRQRRRI